MKKIHIITYILLSALITLGIAPQTFAHTFEQAGTVGVELHVAPSDEPTAGSAATLNFSIQDSAHKFSLENCNCQIKISLAGEQVSTAALTSTALPYIFAKEGTYEVVLDATPKTAEQFEPFSVDFDDVKVSAATAAAGDTTGMTAFYQALILTAVGVVVLAVILFAVHRRKNQLKDSTS